jgi:DNA polymerase-3 subunit alpha
MQTNFIHLNLHTEYSIVDGLIQIESLFESVAEAGMPAIAMTDQGNLFGMVKFYRAAIAAGIKPIIGADLWLHNEQNLKQPFRFLLLCQNQQGYKNLTQLISRSYLQNQHDGLPIIQKSWLTELNAGLIALSGGHAGNIGQALLASHVALAEQLLQEWQQLFPQRFYLELQRSDRTYENEYINAVLPLANRLQVPVVATNAVRFISAEDFEAHEARVCINGGWVLEDSRRPHAYTAQQYLRSSEEMQQLFADIPSALENSVEIAKRCNLELSLGEIFLPNFPVPTGMTIAKYFADEAKKGLAQRGLSEKKYHDRLDMEVEVISKMGFAGYFLIVADFIRWSKQQKIPVGPGRGSGAGSLVAYALAITDLDPIYHELLFERFLNPERISMPDFDIDFCMEGRDRVIDYVAEKYGRDSVAQIITYGTMAARAVVRDVGRVLGLPYGFVDKVAKLIPFELGMTLKKALEQDEQLLKRYQEEDEVRGLIELALKLEGVTRNVGKHAGGVVIAPSKLTDFTPLYCEADGTNLVTQFDKDDVESIGLVKFDFLGLRTLTIIDWAVQTINEKRKKIGEDLLDIVQLPLDDAKTFKLLQACKTTAIFQLESRGMKDLVKRLQPDCFNDIVDLGALFRPGPLQSGMVDDFISRRHGRSRVEYPHPLLETVLRPTYGVILYQEQVMQIAQVLAGYSLGNADLLRRAMGKKKHEEMAQQRAIFVAGATQRNVDGNVANLIFDLMEKFSGYGFNRSHSAAYAVITYQTAWLKAHYPAEFMAAVLSSDMDNTDKVVLFIGDCKNLGLQILPPNINQSHYKFTVTEQGQIIYGLGALKGVGAAAVEIILETREREGEFYSLFEFCQRIDTRKVNRRVLEALIRSGAMDCFGIERSSILASLETALHAAEQQSQRNAVGQVDLFGNVIASVAEDAAKQYIAAPAWTAEQRLLGEKETLGLYLSGHPITRYENELAQFVTARIVDLKPERDQVVMVAGLVVSIKVKSTKSGNRIAFLTLDDQTARIEMVVFSDVYTKYRDLLNKDQLLVVEGEVSIDEFSGGYRISSRRIFNLEQAREMFAKCVWLNMEDKNLGQDFVTNLQQTLMPFRGGKCPICIQYKTNEASTNIALGETWQVKPMDKLLENLKQVCGDEAVLIRY